MKITDIKAYVIPHIQPEPQFHWRKGIPGQSDGTAVGATGYSGILKVETDEGYVGMAGSRRAHYLADLVRRRLKPLYVGCDPTLTEDLWHQIWELDRLEEFTVHELGLLDIACWDIKSQAAGMPVYRMVGGNNPKVPAYASTVTWDTFDEYEQHIKECMDEGFVAFKLHASGDAKWDAELSRRLRKWTGPDADLMFDGSAGWDYVTALWFGHVMEDEGFLWYEEPMREFDLVSYVELTKNLDVPILAAETCDGCHWNAATWIQMRALDMMRVSSGFKGGITGALKVAHLAESFGMGGEVHGGGHANLQICAAIPNNHYYEQLVINTEQIKGLKDMGELSIIDGYITAPERPGILPHPDWDQIEKKAIQIF